MATKKQPQAPKDLVRMVNAAGAVMYLDGNSTMKDLIKMGVVNIRLVTDGAPIPPGYWREAGEVTVKDGDLTRSKRPKTPKKADCVHKDYDVYRLWGGHQHTCRKCGMRRYYHPAEGWSAWKKPKKDKK